jgi:hypothetical protein
MRLKTQKNDAGVDADRLVNGGALTTGLPGCF